MTALRLVVMQLFAPRTNGAQRPMITCPACHGAKKIQFEKGPCEGCSGAGERALETADEPVATT